MGKLGPWTGNSKPFGVTYGVTDGGSSRDRDILWYLQADASIHVTKADQLPEALGQRTRPVVIENDRLERLFSVLLFWSKYGPLALLVAYLIGFGIERRFKIEASLIHDWKIERTEGKVTLTPYSK